MTRPDEGVAECDVWRESLERSAEVAALLSLKAQEFEYRLGQGRKLPLSPTLEVKGAWLRSHPAALPTSAAGLGDTLAQKREGVIGGYGHRSSD